jgi:hypothetical protein
MYDKKLKWIYDIIDTLLSVFRVLALSKFNKTKQIERCNKNCIIMGNGPSLSNLIKENKDVIDNYDLIAVNFMGFRQHQKSMSIFTTSSRWNYL